MSFASKEEIFQHDLKNLNISSNISTELQNRPKSQKTSHDPDPERARDETALTTTPLSTHSANKTAWFPIFVKSDLFFITFSITLYLSDSTTANLARVKT